MYKKIIALTLALAMCATITACGKTDDNTSSDGGSLKDVTIATKGTTTDVETQTTTEATTEVTTETPKHESPVETITYSLCGQISNVDETMDYDTNKNKKFSLKDLVPDGAKVKSFKFVYYSDSGSNIGTYKGGCGISVSEDCPSATNDSWYQSDDFSATADGTYLELDWDVPSEIQDYVDTSGNVQVGYWWSDTQQLRLDEVLCSYEYTTEIPCDETKSKECGNVLTYDGDNKLEIPLSELTSEGNSPRLITVKVSNSGNLGKLVMGMGITQGDEYYESQSLVKLSSSSSETLTWLIPEDVYSNVDNSAKLTIGFWWGESSSITVDSVEVKSAYVEGSVTTTDTTTTTTSENENTTANAQDSSQVSADMLSITSAEIVEDMKIGWNLGNSLDCYDSDDSKITGSAETYWGNPTTTKDMIDKVKASGFNAVRIPVSWTNHIDENNQIDAQWLARVKEVVDYVIEDGMYAIINVHHDDYTWLNPTYADQPEVAERLTAIWSTVAEEFKDYDYHLLFEGLNEPRIIGGTDEWTCGTAEERDVINQLEQNFVDTVRKSGGNNQYRTLIVTTHSASIDETSVKSLVVPNDDRVIVSIHYYSPYDFAGNESDVNTWGTDEDKANLDEGFKLLNETFISKGIPVIIGEFGAVDKDNDDVRANYFNYYIQSAKNYGITCFVWDNNGDFGLLNRASNLWQNDNLITSMMNGLE
jgi:aryl-phospho-beta-D-glucosidase BglC (GH1 family)